MTSSSSFFFPPDAAEGGSDLRSLVVVRVPADAVPRAADKLAHSGAFGLIVLDMTACREKWKGEGILSRLLGLSQKHDIAVLFLTRKSTSSPSLGSLVSLATTDPFDTEPAAQALVSGQAAFVLTPATADAIGWFVTPSVKESPRHG